MFLYLVNQHPMFAVDFEYTTSPPVLCAPLPGIACCSTGLFSD